MTPSLTLVAEAEECCIYCERPFGTAHYGHRRTKDHIVPRSLNGSAGHVREGIVSACGGCNSLKADMMPSAMRAMADEHRKRADALDRIAGKVDALIAERGLLP